MKEQERKFVNQQFQKLLNINLLGFKEIEFSDSISVLLKIEDNLIKKFTYSFYPPLKRNFNVGAISFGIVSPKVNSILDYISSQVRLSYIPKNNIISNSYEHTLQNDQAFYNGQDLNRQISSYNIVENGEVNDQNLIIVTRLFNEYLKLWMLPFFNSVSTIEYINDNIINAIPEEKWSEYIPGLTPFKVTIIMKLYGNPQYHQYGEKVKNTLYTTGLSHGFDRYKDYYNVYCTLLEYLDSGEYKQNTI